MSTSYFAIGLMSGTSLDGLDLCYAKFTREAYWQFEILASETVPYREFWKEQLKNALHLKAEDLLALDKEYGFYLGQKAQEFILKFQITELDLIASHGHTVFHQPQRKFTLQIGDGRALKCITQKPVAYDFRSQDVLLGGNGAPLVPIGDELLFSDYDACINLGGFSNISFRKNHKRIAFDICAVNVVLNALAEKLGQPYDRGGSMARNGKILPELLQKLNALEFYQNPPPKSLGIEWVHQELFPLLQQQNTEDLLATFTEHIAQQISNTLHQYGLKRVLMTGGGTYNTFLLEKIQQKTAAEVVVPPKEIVEYKEALIFALMGVLRLRNEINVLSSATGSSTDHCSGILA